MSISKLNNYASSQYGDGIWILLVVARAECAGSTLCHRNKDVFPSAATEPGPSAFRSSPHNSRRRRLVLDSDRTTPMTMEPDV